MVAPNKTDTNRRRIGMFIASSDVVMLDGFRIVMAACAIVRCEHDFASDTFTYTAISPQFEAIEEGERIPFYAWFFTANAPLGYTTARAQRFNGCERYGNCVFIPE